MLHWQAINHDTGEILASGPEAPEQSYTLASSLVDLRWQYAGQGETVTLQCVDAFGVVVGRWAPHSAQFKAVLERLGEKA